MKEELMNNYNTGKIRIITTYTYLLSEENIVFLKEPNIDSELITSDLITSEQKDNINKSFKEFVEHKND